MTFWRVAPRANVNEMRPRTGLSITIFVVLVGIVSAIWAHRVWYHKNRYAPPFIEVEFYASEDSGKPFYTLYIAEATDSGAVVAVDRDLAVKRRPRLVEVYGQGHLQYDEKTILCDRSSVSIDGQRLPPTPPQAVLKRDGQVIVGAFLRRFD